MKRFLPSFVLVVLSFQYFTGTAFAAISCNKDEVATDLGCLPNDPGGFVRQIYSWGVGFIGMVALLFFIYGAYFVLMSRGDPQQLSKGRSYMFYSLMGMLLAIFGFVFIEFITGTLKVPGFS